MTVTGEHSFVMFIDLVTGRAWLMTVEGGA